MATSSEYWKARKLQRQKEIIDILTEDELNILKFKFRLGKMKHTEDELEKNRLKVQIIDKLRKKKYSYHSIAQVAENCPSNVFYTRNYVNI